MADPRRKGMLALALSSGSSAEEAARAFVARHRAAVLDSRRGPVNGLPAYHLVSRIETRDGVLQAMSAFIEKEAEVYAFHGFASAAAFKNYRAEFEHAIGGFRDLRDPAKINVRPARIRVKAAPSGGPLGGVLRKMGASPESLAELAVLNGKQPHENVAAGTLLKVVEN
jgi:predicted Zn-dependent protease